MSYIQTRKYFRKSCPILKMNPVISLDKTGKIPVYIVKKILTDAKAENHLAQFIKEEEYPVVLNSDADVYTEEGELLLRFRKNVLSQKAMDDAYEAMKDFITKKSSDRGIASGSKPGTKTGDKIACMSNILGYFDKWSIGQKGTFKRSGIKPPGPCRIAAFNSHYPEKFKKIVPLIKEIDAQYEKLCPEEYADQRKAAKLTPFHIKGTSFSTITTNLNFRTAAHQDSGDWPNGFGNLVVIERGAPYKGAYTGFPQYGVGVDCRNGDFLAMDVHRIHGNTPMIPQDETSKRISLVSYLRESIVKKCRKQKMYDPLALEKKIENWRSKTMKLKI